VRPGRRSDLVLAGLCLIAVINGVLLGLSLYALLAAALGILDLHSPSLAYALVAGVAAGLWLLIRALQRERAIGSGGGSWPLGHREWPADLILTKRLEALVSASSLNVAPDLRVLGSEDPNALATGRSPAEAAIVVTEGALRQLDVEEQEAVIAHELAHIEAEDVRAVGLADAVADSIADLARFKGTFLWGPQTIARDLVPFAVTCLGALLLVEVLPKPYEPSGLGEVLLLFMVIVLIFGTLAAIVGSALASWRGLLQLFIFVTFFGPLTVVEMVLAPPTALAISRLVSRGRVYEADRRAVELTGNRAALLSALRKLQFVEHESDTTWSGHLRFSLLLTPRAQRGYRAWLERVYSTHPTVADRLEALPESL
jgi:Zn-dependent protease with chaperone function